VLPIDLFEPAVPGTRLVNIATELYVSPDEGISGAIRRWTHLSSDHIYIGRGSVWGNNYTHLSYGTAQYRVNTRDEAIDRYAEWFEEHRHELPDILTLKDKVLGCWCVPQRCHGEILLGALFDQMAGKRKKVQTCVRCASVLTTTGVCLKCTLIAGGPDRDSYEEFVDRIISKSFGEPVGLVIASHADPSRRQILYYTNPAENSDKVYEVSIDEFDSLKKLYHVNFAYGRRGGTMKIGRKTTNPIPLDECHRIFKELIRDKKDNGYTTHVSGMKAQ